MNSIKNKLLLVLLLVTLLPTLLIGGYTFFSTTESLKESSISAHKSRMLLVREQINGYLGNVSSDVFYLRDFPALHLYLSALESDSSNSERLLLIYVLVLQSFLHKRKFTIKCVLLMFLARRLCVLITQVIRLV